MNMWKCNNCGAIQHDPAKEGELSESDRLCSNCYCGYYEYIGAFEKSPVELVKLHII